MGEVYRAKDTRLGREVAVKVLPDEVASDSGALTRFEREARAVAALSHPNILALHDVGESSGVRFLVTELLQGETLRAALRDGALPVKRSLEIAEQVARGLAAAHENGIVHRDVKPENVFVTRDGHVKVLDFGLARGGALLADGADTRSPTAPVATSPGAVVGTIAYMSPEQAKGQPAGIASDQFSLGVVLYEMLSGVRPFRGSSGAETLTAIIRDEPEPLTKLAPSVPAPVRWIVERCLSKEPGERYDSTRDLARELATVRTNLSEAVAPGGPPTARTRFRRRLLAPVLLLAGLGLGAGAVVIASRPFRAAPPPTFRSLSPRAGLVMSARFAPDFQTVVVSATWDGGLPRMYTLRPGSPEAHDLRLPPGWIWSVAPSGDLLFVAARESEPFQARGSTLYRSSLSGEAPRAIADDVNAASFSPDGKEIAIVRAVRGGESPWQLEYPIGRVLHRGAVHGGNIYVSPDGEKVSLNLGDGGGFVDRQGKVTRVFQRKSLYWVAGWSRRTGRLWFSHWAQQAQPGLLYEVVSQDEVRSRLSSMGQLLFEDSAPDGRLLVIDWRATRSLELLEPGASAPRDVSWNREGRAADISSDGRTLLFTDTGGKEEGPSVFLRRSDGSPAVRLGDGRALAFSRDLRWALAVDEGPILYPTGAGEAQQLRAPGLIVKDGAFFPDGRRLLVLGRQGNGPERCFVVPVEGGTSVPIGPEGVRDARLSDDGRLLYVRTSDEEGAVIPVEGGPSRPVPGLQRRDVAVLLRARDGLLFVSLEEPESTRVDAVDLATGKRREVVSLRAAAPYPLVRTFEVRMTPDARTFFYTRSRHASDLYVVEGLR